VIGIGKKEWSKVDYFMSQREIAKVLGITETDVKRIESRAIAKLRRTGKLDKYIGAKDGI
jgi:DNA-directed RNA polymerase sigma subunit (sigma70/sigma32)